MIEVKILNYIISRNIDGIGGNVFLETPESPPAEYILVQKTGSGRENEIQSATVAIQSISKNRMITAGKINEAVKTAMLEMAGWSDAVYSCRLNSDYIFTNTQTKEYRYQAVFDLFF